MPEKLGEQLENLSTKMTRAPDDYFHEGLIDKASRDHAFIIPENVHISRSGSLRFHKRIKTDTSSSTDAEIREMALATADDSLRIVGLVFDPRINIMADYGFDDQGHGFAREVIIYQSNRKDTGFYKKDSGEKITVHYFGGRKNTIMAFDFGSAHQEVSTQGEGNDEYEKLSISFTTIAADPTHRETAVTYTDCKGEIVPVDLFGILPVRKVTIQMLYDWMQKTFPKTLKPVSIDELATLEKLKTRVAPLFRNYDPTENTLRFIADLEKKGWILDSVQSCGSYYGALDHHTKLEEKHGKENVFHYQMEAKYRRHLVTANLYFIRSK